LGKDGKDSPELKRLAWRRREIESYLCTRAALESYARADATAAAEGPLFIGSEIERRVEAMAEAIAEIGKALETLGKGDPWSPDAKVSDDFLGRFSRPTSKSSPCRT